MSARPYARPKRSDIAQLLELGVLALVGLAVAVAVLWAVIAWAIDQTSTKFVVVVIVLLAGLGLLLFLLALVRTAWRYGKKYDVPDTPRGTASTVTTADGVRLHVESDGPADAPLTVVFAHGVVCSVRGWHHQRDYLSKQLYRRVFYDARGHGRSTWATLDPEIRGVRQLADDLAAVIDQTAPRGALALVGHSMGGMTLFALAQQRPDIWSRVVSAAIIDATPGPMNRALTFGLPRPLAPVSAFLRRESYPFLLLFALVPRFVLRLLGRPPYVWTMALLAVHCTAPRSAVRVTASMAYDATPKHYGRLVGAILDHDERDGLDRLGSIPLLVIGGRRDRLVAFRAQQEWAAQHSNVRVVQIDRCGHMAPLEHPSAVNHELCELLTDAWFRVGEQAAPAAANGHRAVPHPGPGQAQPVTAAVVAAGDALTGTIGQVVEGGAQLGASLLKTGSSLLRRIAPEQEQRRRPPGAP